FEREDVVEAALGQAAVQRHLAAFKTLDAHAGARGLALSATARGLALAGADAAADAHALLARARIVGDIAELHRWIPSLLPVDDPDEMLTLLDHAANRRRIRQFGDAADLIEPQPDQRRALRMVAADRAAGLFDLDRLCGLGHGLKLQKISRQPLRHRRRRD